MNSLYHAAIHQLFLSLSLPAPQQEESVTSVQIGELTCHLTEHPANYLLMFTRLDAATSAQAAAQNLFSQDPCKPVLGFDADSLTPVAVESPAAAAAGSPPDPPPAGAAGARCQRDPPGLTPPHPAGLAINLTTQLEYIMKAKLNLQPLIFTPPPPVQTQPAADLASRQPELARQMKQLPSPLLRAGWESARLSGDAAGGVCSRARRFHAPCGRW